MTLTTDPEDRVKVISISGLTVESQKEMTMGDYIQPRPERPPSKFTMGEHILPGPE